MKQFSEILLKCRYLEREIDKLATEIDLSSSKELCFLNLLYLFKNADK